MYVLHIPFIIYSTLIHSTWADLSYQQLIRPTSTNYMYVSLKQWSLGQTAHVKKV